MSARSDMVKAGLFSCVIGAYATACKASNDTPTPTPIGDASSDAVATSDAIVETPPIPARTIVSAPLFGDTSPANLLIDPRFENGQYGQGRWYVATHTALTSFTNLTLSDAPVGVAFPVGVFTGMSELQTALAQVVGGPGPFSAQVWITTSDPSTPMGGVGASVVAASASTGEASATGTYDLTEDVASARTIAGRTWHHFVATIPDAIEAGGYFELTIPSATATWWFQAPELVPTALSTNPLATGARPIAHPRATTEEERDAVRRLRALPLPSRRPKSPHDPRKPRP